MLILFTKFNKFLFIILLSFFAETAFASQQAQMASEPATDWANSISTFERDALNTANGLIMLDYEVISVPENNPLDLLGIHYLHQLNGWFFLGLGAHAPLVDGNYGGFMAFDATAHAQRKIFGNFFIDAGASFGGGGGGSSINQSRELSGTGGYIKSYAGLGYDFHGFSLGVNYTHFQFMNSRINDSQSNFFIQKPVSYSIGSYANSGKKTVFDATLPEAGQNILTLELNNIFQVNPIGLNKKTIDTLSLQLSHFINRKHYLFLGADVGYYGLPLYNQVVGGIGSAYSLSPRVNFYKQIGVGSGGFSPDIIDTGSGLLVYPKLSVEYLLNNNFGISFSGGYLFAPKGSSKNITIGAALKYHISTEEQSRRFRTAEGLVFKGFRFNIFQQTEFNVRFGNKNPGNINLLSVQFDNIVNDKWYIPFQFSVAYNDFFGYPGYGELLAGLGVQSKFYTTNSIQNFFQILIGANVHSFVLKPSIGINYSLSDNFALYAQAGRTISLSKINLHANYNKYNNRLNSNFIGFGLTYRFSFLDTL